MNYYYRIYTFYKNIGDFDIYFKIAGTITTIEMLNILTLLIFLRDKIGITIPCNDIILLGSIIIILLLSNCLIFLKEKKYLEIIEKYKFETLKQKRISVIITISYLVVTLILLIIVL